MILYLFRLIIKLILTENIRMEKVNSKHYIVMILIYFSIQMVH